MRLCHAAGRDDILAMYSLGVLLHNRGKPTDAETWYRKAADNGDAAAMNDLANLLRNRGEHREAETWYQRAANA